MWTHFWDMHSGGRQKEPQGHIFIEADEETAKKVFYAKLGHNPDRVTCTCCGADYSPDEGEDLAQMTAYHRGCAYDGTKYIEEPDTQYGPRDLIPLAEYLASDEVLVIPASEITEAERTKEVPVQGYVWRS